MRSLLSILTLSLIPLLFMAPELSAQPEPIMIYAVEALGHADGTFSSRRLVYDRQTGLFSPVAEHDAPPVAGQAEALLPPNFMFKPLIVLQSSRWAGSAAKTFRVAEEAPTNSRLLMKNIARVRGVMNLVHRRKGSLRIPRFIFSNQNVPVQDIVDPVLEYQQFNLDGRNVVARTADNRFFRFDPPGITSRVLRFEFANSDDCTLDGGVFRCRFFVQECDIYVKARTMMDPGFFEDLTVLRQRQALAGLLKFCHGHNLNTWGHDLGGDSEPRGHQSGVQEQQHPGLERGARGRQAPLRRSRRCRNRSRSHAAPPEGFGHRSRIRKASGHRPDADRERESLWVFCDGADESQGIQ